MPKSKLFWKTLRVGRVVGLTAVSLALAVNFGESLALENYHYMLQSRSESIIQEMTQPDSEIQSRRMLKYYQTTILRIGTNVLNATHRELKAIEAKLLGQDDSDDIFDFKLDITSDIANDKQLFDLDSVQRMIFNLENLKWRFVLLESPDINAFVVPGIPSTVFVKTGAIQCMSEQQLAFVICHELGHMISNHASQNVLVKILGRWLELTVLAVMDPFIGFGDFVLMGALYNLRKRFLEMPISRQFEHTADIIGLRMFSAAGYDPRASLEAMEILKALQEGSSSVDLISSDFTHPFPEDRQELLQKYLPATFNQWQTDMKKNQGFGAALKRLFEGPVVSKVALDVEFAPHKQAK
jgi:Zn-dependent protease with chaperone function